MCGRFAFFSAAEAVSQLFGVDDATLSIRPQYNIAPTDLAAVIRSDESARGILMMLWGLLPFWAIDKKMALRMIYARAETVAEKPAYRDAFKKARCIVPADGYYEWVATAGGKQPFYISDERDRPLGMAGLWSHWKSKDGEERLDTFTILTTESTGAIADLHHRMPVMLDDISAEHWLAGDGDNPPVLREILSASAATPLRAWPVTKAVNTARNDGEALIEPQQDED